MMRAFPWVYLIAAFAFIYLPVGTLVLFSFQEGNLPVPPFNGPSIKWYADILADDDLTSALGNSLLVASRHMVWRATCCQGRPSSAGCSSHH